MQCFTCRKCERIFSSVSDAGDNTCHECKKRMGKPQWTARKKNEVANSLLRSREPKKPARKPEKRFFGLIETEHGPIRRLFATKKDFERSAKSFARRKKRAEKKRAKQWSHDLVQADKHIAAIQHEV